MSMVTLDEDWRFGDRIATHMGHVLEAGSEREARDALRVLHTLGPNSGAEPTFEMEAHPEW